MSTVEAIAGETCYLTGKDLKQKLQYPELQDKSCKLPERFPVGNEVIADLQRPRHESVGSCLPQQSDKHKQYSILLNRVY